MSQCPVTGCTQDNRFLVDRIRLLIPDESRRLTYTNSFSFKYRTMPQQDGRFLLIMAVGEGDVGEGESVDENSLSFFCFEAEGRDEDDRKHNHNLFQTLRRDDVTLRSFPLLMKHIAQRYDRIIVRSVESLDDYGRVKQIEYELVEPQNEIVARNLPEVA